MPKYTVCEPCLDDYMNGLQTFIYYKMEGGWAESNKVVHQQKHYYQDEVVHSICPDHLDECLRLNGLESLIVKEFH